MMAASLAVLTVASVFVALTTSNLLVTVSYGDALYSSAVKWQY